MPFPRPNFVFTCFKHIERCADKVTGAAGPLFIGVAILLFVIGTLCFRMSLIVQCRPINRNLTQPFSRCHSPDSPMALAIHITVFPDHYQLVRPLLLRLHRIPGLRW
jgi:hypothetical protein